MQFETAFIEPLNSDEEYTDVEIHDNGWVEAYEPERGARGRRLFIPPSAIDHIYPTS